jgi:hypothetical protein
MEFHRRRFGAGRGKIDASAATSAYPVTARSSAPLDVMRGAVPVAKCDFLLRNSHFAVHFFILAALRFASKVTDLGQKSSSNNGLRLLCHPGKETPWGSNGKRLARHLLNAKHSRLL